MYATPIDLLELIYTRILMKTVVRTLHTKFPNTVCERSFPQVCAHDIFFIYICGFFIFILNAFVELSGICTVTSVRTRCHGGARVMVCTTRC